MAFEGREAELGMLLGRMRKAPEDWHELYEQVRQTLNQMKATGMPLPLDLVQFEQDLEAEFEAENTDDTRRARLDALIEQRGIDSDVFMLVQPGDTERWRSEVSFSELARQMITFNFAQQRARVPN